MKFLAVSGVEDLLRGLWASLCQFIYGLVAWLYELFMNLSRIEILTEDKIKPIYQRLTLILTIVMVFYITFEVVKYVIEPSEFTDKEKGGGKLAMKMVIVVLLIAFVPQMFGWAHKLQNLIFDNQVFSKVLLGKTSADTENFGRVFSSNILGMFYYPETENFTQSQLETETNCDGVSCATVVNLNLNNMAEHGSLKLLHVGLNSTGKIDGYTTNGKKLDAYYIHFDGLFATAVGIFIGYMLLMYCIDVGVRAAQLTFLQIIAPIPILGYLSPKKDGMFQKWLRQCITTYLDLFIRVGIIYFVILICQILGQAYADGTLLNNIPGTASPMMKLLIYLALIMGLLMFAQKAPKMLGELFPSMGAASGNFGLKAKDRYEPTLNAAKKTAKGVAAPFKGGKRVAGAVSGAAVGIASAIKDRKSIGANNEKGFGKFMNTAYSAVKAGAAGAKAGASKNGGIRSGAAAARQSVQKDVGIADKGGTVMGHDILGGFNQAKSVKQDRRIEAIKSAGKAKDRLFSQVDELAEVKSLKKSWDAAKSAGDDKLAKTLEAQYKAASQAARTAIVGENGNVPTTPLTYEYKDSDGNLQTGTYTFDSGDYIFASAINDISKDEFKKLQGTPIGDTEIEINRLNPDGTPSGTRGKVKISEFNEAEYTAYLHKIADVAKAKEQSEYNSEYYKAHANANADAPGGKKS